MKQKPYDKQKRERLRKAVLERVKRTPDEDGEDLEQLIAEVLKEEDYRHPVSYDERMQMEKYLMQALCGYDILQDLMDDETITEIMVNGPDRIFFERGGRLYPWEEAFSSEEQLRELIQQIVGRYDRRVNASTPVVDCRLPDGSRVHVVLPPVSTIGPVMTIRKFPKDIISLERLVHLNMFPIWVGDYLVQAVRNGENIFISGGTGSGKTTLLNALTEFIPPNERIVSIEDSKELNLKDCPNWVSLECKPANMEGEGEVNIRDLLKAALRMRPDRIIVGEVRGGECLDLLQALNTGHRGSLSTGHGNSCEDMLRRIETMALMGMEIPLSAIRNQIIGGIQLLVHIERDASGKREVVSVKRVKGLEGDAICLEEVYGSTT